MAVPAGYRERLRIEGAVLAACAVLATVAVLVAGGDEATERPWSTVIQLVVVALGMGFVGVRAVRGWVRSARAVSVDEAGTGEPTPLWHIVAIVVVLTALLAWRSWDGALHLSLGCVVVGVFQAVVFARVVAEEEVRSGRVFVRLRGSSLRSTVVGFVAGTERPQ